MPAELLAQAEELAAEYGYALDDEEENGNNEGGDDAYTRELERQAREIEEEHDHVRGMRVPDEVAEREASIAALKQLTFEERVNLVSNSSDERECVGVGGVGVGGVCVCVCALRCVFV